VSILSHGLTADSNDNERHPACVMFDQLLDAIVADQDKGNSYVMRHFVRDFGESCAASVMQAAGIRRLRNQHAKNCHGEEDINAPASPSGDAA